MSKEQQTILIVDDGELNRAILSQLFCNRYKVIEVENGKKAMDVLEKYRHDLVMVLLDIVMPVMDGLEVLRQLRARDYIYEIPVIMITSEKADATAIKCYELGASDIITKPFNPNIVLKRAENIIELFKHKYNVKRMVKQQMDEIEKQSQNLNNTNNFIKNILNTAIQFRTGEYSSHIERVQDLTRVLLRAISQYYSCYNLNIERIEKIVCASAVHDIGNIVVPAEILNKPEKLTQEEFDVVKNHTEIGCNIIEKLEYTEDEESYRYCWDICKYHHERWDGKGYPCGLVGDQIPIWTQVVSLADAYDSLTSDRAFRDAYTHEDAVKMILKGECGTFNPKLLDCFIDVQETLCNQVEEDVDVVSKVEYVPKNESEEDISRKILWVLELERKKNFILSEISGEIIFDYDKQSDTISFSEKYRDVFNGEIKFDDTKNTLLSTSNISPQDIQVLFEKLNKMTPNNSVNTVKIQIKNKDGIFEWFEIYIWAIFDPETNSECVGYLGKITHIDK